MISNLATVFYYWINTSQYIEEKEIEKREKEIARKRNNTLLT